MNTLIVLSAALAVAVATPGYLGAAPAAVVAPAAYAAPAVVAAPVHPGYAAYGPAPIAVRSDDYLLDTPDVAVSRAAHLTAIAQTRARNVLINGAAVLAAPAVAAPVTYAAPGALAVAAHLQAKAALMG